MDAAVKKIIAGGAKVEQGVPLITLNAVTANSGVKEIEELFSRAFKDTYGPSQLM